VSTPKIKKKMTSKRREVQDNDPNDGDSADEFGPDQTLIIRLPTKTYSMPITSSSSSSSSSLPETLDHLSKTVLKNMCAERGLPVSGTVDVLRKRLRGES
jgi:hypothetical protein